MASGIRMKLQPGEMSRREAIKAVKAGRLKRRPERDIEATIDELVARNPEAMAELERVVAVESQRQAVLAEWGEPCGEYEPECWACQAWRAFETHVALSYRPKCR